MSKRPSLFSALIFIVLPVAAVSAVGAFISGGSRDPWYASLNKAPLNPPDIAFAIVWPTLFLLMMVSGFLVWRKAGGFAAAGRAFGLFYTQLAFNIGWSWLFFQFNKPLWALADLAALWLLVALMIAAF